MSIADHGPLDSSRRGLTFGEMLIVLAVFLILAAIFVLSSQEVMVRTRLSTALAEEKTIANALSRYEFDNEDVPTQQKGLVALEQPVSFMAMIPTDTFTKGSTAPKPYQYYRDLSPAVKWILVSVGPDGNPDVQKALADRQSNQTALASSSDTPTTVFATNEDLNNFVARYSYDPTNGTVSRGDVIKLYGH